MPAPDSAAAMARLVKARARLNQVTKEFNEAFANMLASTEARQRYFQLKAEWAEAFTSFEKATEELSATLKQVKDELDRAE